MTPAAALAALRAAGVTVALQPGGVVRMEADAPPPSPLLAAVRPLRDGIILLLVIEGGPITGVEMRPPTWSNPLLRPRTGWLCRCCGGRRWWTEPRKPKGWRCCLCAPGDHLDLSERLELNTGRGNASIQETP